MVDNRNSHSQRNRTQLQASPNVKVTVRSTSICARSLVAWEIHIYLENYNAVQPCRLIYCDRKQGRNFVPPKTKFRSASEAGGRKEKQFSIPIAWFTWCLRLSPGTPREVSQSRFTHSTLIDVIRIEGVTWMCHLPSFSSARQRFFNNEGLNWNKFDTFWGEIRKQRKWRYVNM